MLFGNEDRQRHSGLFGQAALRPLEGVFSPEVLELSRHCPITSGHLRQYEHGDMSVNETLNAIVLAQAEHNKHLLAEAVRAYGLGMQPITLTINQPSTLSE